MGSLGAMSDGQPRPLLPGATSRRPRSSCPRASRGACRTAAASQSSIHQLLGGLRAGMGYCGAAEPRRAAPEGALHAHLERGPPGEPRPRRDHHQGSPELPDRVARRRWRSDAHRDRILILDFGSQFTQLIARRVREHARLLRDPPGHARRRGDRARWTPGGRSSSPAGPSSVYEPGAPARRSRAPRARRAGARRSATGSSSWRTARRRGGARRTSASTAAPS